jgi:hypothetical protein
MIHYQREPSKSRGSGPNTLVRVALARSIILVVLLGTVVSLRAQVPATPHANQIEFFFTISNAFHPHHAFTCEMEVTGPLFARPGQPGSNVSMPLRLAMADGKIRMESWFPTGVSNAGPQVLEMKRLHVDHHALISNPEKHALYIIFPEIAAYGEKRLFDFQQPDARKTKIEFTDLGKGKVGGHDCVKKRLVFSDDFGKLDEVTVWYALDLTNFPARLEMTDSSNSIAWTLKDVMFERPKPEIFEPPANYTRVQKLSELTDGSKNNSSGP